MKETHAPGWRGRPKRTGPIAADELPAWLLFLEKIAPTGCFVIAAIVVGIAFYAFGVDWLAGHL